MKKQGNILVPLKSWELQLVPIHLGWRVTRIKIGEVPLEINIFWLMATVLFDMKDIAIIVEVHKLY